MGAGKTTVGARLANRLERPFVDSDSQLQARVQRTAADIATTDGVTELHTQESAALLDALAATPPAVIGAAASVVDDSAARVRLAANDVTTVWLRARPTTLRERAVGGEHRPFVSEDATAIDRLDRARRAGYETVADLVVDVDEREPEEIVTEIVGALTP